MSTTKHLLEDEIQAEIEEISKMEIGSEKHKMASEALSKLVDKYNDMDKLELEYQDKYDGREAELSFKEKQLEYEQKDARIKNYLTATSICGGFLITIWGVCKSLKFEETGVFSSLISRGWVQKIIPKK